MGIPLLFSRPYEGFLAALIMLWLAACALSSAAAGQAHQPQQAAEEVQRLTSECEQGKYASCSDLGGIHAHGRGVSKDEARAAAFYQRACDAGRTLACGKPKKPVQ